MSAKKTVEIVWKCQVLGCRRRKTVLPRRFYPKGSIREIVAELCERCTEDLRTGVTKRKE